MATMCEFCDKRPATHRCRVAGCGDERACVCCECLYEGSMGYAERCTPEDDCWTVDEANEYRRTNYGPER